MKGTNNERAEIILEQAAKLFQEVGYERASMNELVKRIGGSKSTIYNYFSSKEDLLVAVVKQHATRHISEAASEIMHESRQAYTLEESLIRFGEGMLQVLTNDTIAMSMYRMVVAESGHTDIGMLFYEAGPRESVEKLSVLMSWGMDRKELRLADPHLRALQFLALITAETNMRVFQKNLHPLTSTRIKEMVKNGVHMFLRGAA